MIMHAISSPISRVGNNATIPNTRPGKNPSTGIDCNTSNIGSISRSVRALRAAAVANSSVNTSDTAYAASPRHKLKTYKAGVLHAMLDLRLLRKRRPKLLPIRNQPPNQRYNRRHHQQIHRRRPRQRTQRQCAPIWKAGSKPLITQACSGKNTAGNSTPAPLHNFRGTPSVPSPHNRGLKVENCPGHVRCCKIASSMGCV